MIIAVSDWVAATGALLFFILLRGKDELLGLNPPCGRERERKTLGAQLEALEVIEDVAQITLLSFGETQQMYRCASAAHQVPGVTSWAHLSEMKAALASIERGDTARALHRRHGPPRSGRYWSVTLTLLGDTSR